ncbi:MAG TPA: hypothetical protein VFX65_14340, partial [Candidatus Limnocylindrales bacterium]|nr:hypothetical protein [Candidatus Limnocylindrales bacterium]
MTTTRRRRPGALRRLAGLLLATATAGLGPGLLPALVPSLAPALGPGAARAATPDLTFVTATTYVVLPDEGRVAVTVRITATNHLKDTTARRYFFEEGFLSVLPGTSNFAISGGSGSPSVAVSSSSAGAVVLRLRFGARLAAGQSASFTLTFDLVDPGGAPDRPVRISPSLVRFQAWAFASDSTPGSSVEVVVPPAYTVEVGRGPLGGPTPNAEAWQVFTSGPLETPLTFVADIFADRPAEYVDGRRSATVGGRTVFLVIRAWPDDAAWRERVS